jgi:hypothetical protein
MPGRRLFAVNRALDGGTITMSKILRVGALLSFGLFVSGVGRGQPPIADVAVPAVAESFGPGPQVLNIGAAAFQHLNNSSGYEIDWFTDGYMGYTDETFLGVFVAPLQLPSGASIVSICVYFHDTAPVGKVTAYLEALKLMPAGNTSPGVVQVLGPLENDTDTGYLSACSETAYTFRNFADLDGDGSGEDIVHRLRVDMGETGEGRLALGGVSVTWNREVSPAPLNPTFGDVPADHPYFQFVEALGKSGITAGCSGGNFCPDAPLTRGQMAVFLSKALGLHWLF